MDIDDDPRLEIYFDLKDREESTKRRTKDILKNYLRSQEDDLTLSELVQEAIIEEKEDVHKLDRKIVKRLIRFKKWCKKQGHSQLTQKIEISRVKSFYRTFIDTIPDVTVTVKRKSGSIEDLPTDNDLRLAHHHANIKYKAIILLMHSSGMAIEEIRSLLYHDFLKSISDYYKPPPGLELDINLIASALEKEDVIATWKGHVRGKTNQPFLTFNTPETTGAILTYLKQSPPTNIKDPLFRVSRKSNTGFKRDTASDYFRHLNRRCGFEKTGKKWHYTTHDNRRIFASKLTEEDVSYLKFKYFMGHVLKAVDGSYAKIPRAEKMKETYLRVMPRLTLLEEVNIREITTEDKAEFEAMKRREQEKDDIIGDMKARLELLESVAGKELEQVKKAKKDLPKPKN